MTATVFFLFTALAGSAALPPAHTVLPLPHVQVADTAPVPTTRQFTLAPGETLRVTIYEGGAGIPIVIVPGMIGSAFSFRHVSPELARRGHRIFVIDMLGTGASTRPTKADYSLTAQSRRIEAVMDSLGVRNALVVAHAIGGSIVMRLALHRPDLVQSIVGIDTGAAEHAATPGIRKAMRFAPIIKLFGAKRILVGKIKDGLIDASADPGWVTPEVVAHYAEPYREDAGNALRVLQAMAGSKEPEALVPSLPTIATPMLLLVGTAGNSLAEEKIQVLRTGLTTFSYQRVENSGQFIQEEQPQIVIEAILRLTVVGVAGANHRRAARPSRFQNGSRFQVR